MTEKTTKNEVREKIMKLKYRDNPTIHKKVVKEDDGIGSHLVKNKIKEKYKYYVCDYCGQEIKIEKDWNKKNGGKATLPRSLTRSCEIVLALHNQCLKTVIKEFEEV